MISDRPAVNASPVLSHDTPRRFLVAALVALAVAACGGRAQPPPPPTEGAERIACDQFAARAIQTGDPTEAAALSQRATDCYTALRPAVPPSDTGSPQ